jgi:hypothetical protein
MPALLNQGKTAIRDSLKTLVTHVGVSTDSTAFSAAQTTLNPGGGTNLIKTATETNVTVTSTDDAFDAVMTINGSSEFTGLTIRTIGLLNGSSASNALLRRVRTAGIGVEAGDVFTIGVRIQVQDNSA